MEIQTIIFAFSLTLFAGLSTGIGSALAFYTKKTNATFLSFALGFSAGVMIYVSMIEIFPKALDSLNVRFSYESAYLLTTLSFFGGIGLIALIDHLVPNTENPHEIHDINELDKEPNKALLRMGLFSALAIAIHNFPEGLATFMSALQDPGLGISIAIAIAIHNIPEGISVSVPIYFATGDKKKAFTFSFLSGLSEPVGALIGYFLLYNLLNETLFGIVFASVAGIMVYISLDELLPTAEKYGKHHIAITGLILGMIVMAVSLILFV
jgi:ZIP family zinc transporter